MQKVAVQRGAVIAIGKVTASDIKKALAKKHEGKEFFLAECKNGPTWTARPGEMVQFDAVAIYKTWRRPRIVGYEIKISRGDFLRDNKYPRYLPFCHEFYFVTPTGLVQRQETEENIGLIYYNPEKQSLRTRKKAVYRDIEIDSEMLLYIIFSRLESDRVPFHSAKAEYWNDWLDNKLSNRALGLKVSSRLLEKVKALEAQVRELQGGGDNPEQLMEIDEVLEKHGIRPFYSRAQAIDKALAKRYPGGLDYVEHQLRQALSTVEELVHRKKAAQ